MFNAVLIFDNSLCIESLRRREPEARESNTGCGKPHTTSGDARCSQVKAKILQFDTTTCNHVGYRCLSLRTEAAESQRQIGQAKHRQKTYEDGVIPFPEFVASSQEIFDAQVAVAAGAGERIAACEEYVARQKDMKDKVEALFNNGSRGGETEKYALAKLSLIKAKVLLAKERKAATARKK